MNDSSKNVIISVLGIILVIATGVGGYYLGWYMDKVAAAKYKEEQKGVNKVFNIEGLGIKITYPGDWSSVATEVKDGVKIYETTSPQGSIFGYRLGTENGNESICDTKSPNGNGKNVKKCTFVTGNPGFARFQEGSEWRVARLDGKLYFSYDGDTFYYILGDSKDLESLDKIMKSVIISK